MSLEDMGLVPSERMELPEVSVFSSGLQLFLTSLTSRGWLRDQAIWFGKSQVFLAQVAVSSVQVPPLVVSLTSNSQGQRVASLRLLNPDVIVSRRNDETSPPVLVLAHLFTFHPRLSAHKPPTLVLDSYNGYHHPYYEGREINPDYFESAAVHLFRSHIINGIVTPFTPQQGSLPFPPNTISDTIVYFPHSYWYSKN